MGKYTRLGEFLRAQRSKEVPMTFSEIERVIGGKLPPNSPQYPAWWSNNPSNNVMTKVWLDAGFRTEQVDIEGRKLVFRRVSEPSVSDADDVGRKAAPAASKACRTIAAYRAAHPLSGTGAGFFETYR